MSSRRTNRYLAFVDFLGTAQLYTNAHENAERIEDHRYELEHAIHLKLQKLLARGDIEVGVFSDTAMVAGKDLSIVCSAATLLLDYVLGKNLSRGDVNDIRLLRGGLSVGPELRAGYLRQSRGLSVIPFFDGGLAFAYQLEGLRRGSRLYLESDLARALPVSLHRFLFHWTTMTGSGVPTADIYEFLWPAFACAERPLALAERLPQLFRFWRSGLASKHLSPNAYRETLYHLDETLKTHIRSTVAFAKDVNVGEIISAMVAVLPSEQDPMRECEIRYIWGIWFQAIFVLETVGMAERFHESVSFAMAELKSRGYWDKFVAEAEHEDYAIMNKYH